MTQEEVDKILIAMTLSTVAVIKTDCDKSVLSYIALKDAVFLKSLFTKIAPEAKMPKEVKKLIDALEEM